jgi:hypothetical protein
MTEFRANISLKKELDSDNNMNLYEIVLFFLFYSGEYQTLSFTQVTGGPKSDVGVDFQFSASTMFPSALHCYFNLHLS